MDQVYLSHWLTLLRFRFEAPQQVFRIIGQVCCNHQNANQDQQAVKPIQQSCNPSQLLVYGMIFNIEFRFCKKYMPHGFQGYNVLIAYGVAHSISGLF